MPAATTQAPHEWSEDALYAKAQRFAEAMRAHVSGDWRRALWATFVLELLARSALAHFSPVLLVDTRTDWNNLLHAIGRAPLKPKFLPRAAPISEVASRLGEIEPGLRGPVLDTVVVQMQWRNRQLHSGLAEDDIDWPGFYRSCQQLSAVMGRGPADLLGAEEAAIAAKVVDAADDKSAENAKGDVGRHAASWRALAEGERDTLGAQAAVWASRREGHRVLCPACGSTALVVGAPLAPPKVTVTGDRVTERQEFLPNRFECVACGLRLARLADLIAVGGGLGNHFTATGEFSVAEYFGEQLDADPYSDWEPDFNEY